ncbi:hypothetical protein HYW83_06210 [Candidatus Peregrinibacteria bacterium]|nr:hypothetical protein [Candidatus Peregrinibacteria bacterium]
MEALRETTHLDAKTFKRLVIKACGPEAKRFKALGELRIGEKRTFLICDRTRGDHCRIEGTVVGFQDAGASTDVGDFGMQVRDPVFDFTIFHPDGTTESLKNALISDQKIFEVKVFRKPTEADWEARSRRIESMCDEDDDEEDEEMVAMTVPFPKGTLVATRTFMPGGMQQNIMMAYDGAIEDRVVLRNLPKGQQPSEEIRQMADALCLSLDAIVPGKGKGRAVKALRTITGRRVRTALAG